MTRTRSWVAALLAVGFAVAGTIVSARILVGHGQPRSVASPGPSVDRIDADFSGCAGVLAGPVCELSVERTLLVVARVAKDARVSFETNRGPVEVVRQDAVEDETRWRVHVPEGATVVRLRAVREGGIATWELALRPSPEPIWLTEARANRKAGKIDEALAAVTPHMNDGGVEGAWATGLVARIRYRRGDVDSAVALLRETMATHIAHGRISDVTADGTGRAYMLNHERYAYSEAAQTLDDVTRASSDFSDAKAMLPYFRAQIALETGNLRRALALLSLSRAAAMRLDLGAFVSDATGAMAGALSSLGRFEEARDLVVAESEKIGPNTVPFKQGTALGNRAVHTIRLLEWLGTSSPRCADLAADADESLRRALEIFSDENHLPSEQANGLTELARLQVFRGNLNEARASLARARAIHEKPFTELLVEQWRLEGEIAFRERRFADAVAAYKKLHAIATGLGVREPSWIALTGAAAALEALGQIPEALDAYMRAERALDQTSTFVPLGSNHGSFVTLRDTSARGRIDLLLRLGRTEDARAAAAQSRARLLRAVRVRGVLDALPADSRASWDAAIGAYRRERTRLDGIASKDWELSAAEVTVARARRAQRDFELRSQLESTLSALMPGLDLATNHPAKLESASVDDVELAFNPLPVGWVGFVTRHGHTLARRLPDVALSAAPSLIAAALLEPFGDRLAAESRLRVYSFGKLDATDIHALPFRGKPLFTRVAVAYGLDSSVRLRGSEAGATVIVADPNGNLPRARNETDALVRLASSHHDSDVRTFTQTAATRSAVLQAIDGAALFHFAGHGSFAMGDAWESMLSLSGADHISVSDVFALKAAPERVILSACDGARASADGLGMAQAFVAAGARVVIAPTRRVSDDVAEAMSLALFEELSANPRTDGADALRRAQISLGTRHPEWDVAAYRAIVGR